MLQWSIKQCSNEAGIWVPLLGVIVGTVINLQLSDTHKTLSLRPHLKIMTDLINISFNWYRHFLKYKFFITLDHFLEWLLILFPFGRATYDLKYFEITIFTVCMHFNIQRLIVRS